MDSFFFWKVCDFVSENQQNPAVLKQNLKARTFAFRFEAVSLCYERFEPSAKSAQKSAIDKSATAMTTPVVMLHGLFGSKFNWRSLAKSYSAALSTEV